VHAGRRKPPGSALDGADGCFFREAGFVLYVLQQDLDGQGRDPAQHDHFVVGAFAQDSSRGGATRSNDGGSSPHFADDRALPMPTGEKTMLIIENTLTTYSVARTYAFCWQGAVASADFEQRRNVSAAHAGNAVVGNCQRRVDLARVKQWEVENFIRAREVRRTHLSFTLFDAFLGFGDRAFTVPLAQLFEEERGGRCLTAT